MCIERIHQNDTLPFFPFFQKSVDSLEDQTASACRSFTAPHETPLLTTSPSTSPNQSAKNLVPLRSSIDSMIILALEGNHLCRLIAKHGGIRSLLTISVEPRLRKVRVNAFRWEREKERVIINFLKQHSSDCFRPYRPQRYSLKNPYRYL